MFLRRTSERPELANRLQLTHVFNRDVAPLVAVADRVEQQFVIGPRVAVDATLALIFGDIEQPLDPHDLHPPPPPMVLPVMV